MPVQLFRLEVSWYVTFKERNEKKRERERNTEGLRKRENNATMWEY